MTPQHCQIFRGFGGCLDAGDYDCDDMDGRRGPYGSCQCHSRCGHDGGDVLHHEHRQELECPR